MGSWERWIAEVLEEHEDSAIRRLREQLATGARLVRINLLREGEGAPPRYSVVLEEQNQLQSVTLPHSASFTRWSLEARARMETLEEEALRMAILARERLQGLARELGSDYFRALLVNHLRLLGPPRTLSLLAAHDENPVSDSASKVKAVAELNRLLTSLARDLRTLAYGESEIAELLDRALERYVDDLFHLRLREKLFGR